jgi:hypothetical protein
VSPVHLLPPRTAGAGVWGGEVPLTSGPRYARTRGMSRWHRVRSAVRYPDETVHYAFWCGPGGRDLLTADQQPTAEPVCGTCAGRALGAGQDDTPVGMPLLRFDPRWMTAPARCPGSNNDALYTELAPAVGRCLACGQLVPLRAHGGPYRGGYGPTSHQPGSDLIEACPWHAWNWLVRCGDGAGCGCGWTGQPSGASLLADDVGLGKTRREAI